MMFSSGYRAIVAIDIEQSTTRPDPVKAELRRGLYELFDQALRSAGIHRRHRDRFTDRGDGLLALIHPVDQAAKPVLLNRVVPAFGRLLAGYDASLTGASLTGRSHRQVRVRVVVHAGEVNYDGYGCFGEALDIAFRLLDAPGVKKALRCGPDPLTLVVSDDIYRTVVTRVDVAGRRYLGWVQAPRRAAQLQVAELASYRRSA
jgi:hypothetical protein